MATKKAAPKTPRQKPAPKTDAAKNTSAPKSETIAEVMAKEAEKSVSPASSQAVVADATLSEKMSDSPLGDKEPGEFMAVDAVLVTSALPAAALALTICSKVHGFRRAGRAWSTTAEIVSANEFTEEQVEALLAEPMLDVVVAE